jgi:AraC family transcriptional regulator of adaptative response/methylated-DNA-[protein]-cysteine methyltransferase
MNDCQRIARVIEYLDEHYREQPDLRTLAGRAMLSPHHFHRLFSRWAGITPKDFLQCLTISHAKALLREGRSVLDTALDAGLSGPGRLHDLCVHLESASPGEFKSGGSEWTITAGLADSPFGTCLVGTGPRGICHLSFVESVNRRQALATIGGDWPQAHLEWDDDAASALIKPLFETSNGQAQRPPLRAVVRGTAFQVRVWRALLQVPSGRLVSYGQLAETVCTRAAARAVGSAVAANPLAYLIPCHRVIRETGVIGDYRWGRTRKQVIIAWEASTRPT